MLKILHHFLQISLYYLPVGKGRRSENELRKALKRGCPLQSGLIAVKVADALMLWYYCRRFAATHLIFGLESV